MVAIAQIHLERKLDENWGLSSSYNHHPESIQLVGAQKLSLDERDAANHVQEQWCLVFRYDLERGDPESLFDTYAVYQMNLKRFGWIPTFLPVSSDSFFYEQVVADTWERCLDY